MSFALLFSGQGTQHADMWPWLAGDAALVQQTQAALGVPDWRLAMHDDPTWAERNRVAQVLLTGLGLAGWARLSPHLPMPAAIAGYSVGELAAFSAAGVFAADTAMQLAAARADAMDRCAAASPGGLVAVSGLTASAVDAVCATCATFVAIRIDVDSAVVGGPCEALDHCEQVATALGARCTALKIGVPSHTPSMQPAADAFDRVLAGLASSSPWPSPASVLIDNLAAERVHDGDGARRSLSQQIAHTVLWSDCLAAIETRRVACVLEIGPGAALASMWNRRYPDIPARSADEFRSAASVIAWVLQRVSRRGR